MAKGVTSEGVTQWPIWPPSELAYEGHANITQHMENHNKKKNK